MSILTMKQRPSLGDLAVRGFTLIEMMVVIALVGILISVVSLAIGSGNRTNVLQAQAQRLISSMRFAQQRASALNRPVGIEFYEAGYQLLEYRAGNWELIENVYSANEITLPDGISVIEPAHQDQFVPGVGAVVMPELAFMPSADLPVPAVVLYDEALKQDAVITQTGIDAYVVALGNEARQ